MDVWLIWLLLAAALGAAELFTLSAASDCSAGAAAVTAAAAALGAPAPVQLLVFVAGRADRDLARRGRWCCGTCTPHRCSSSASTR